MKKLCTAAYVFDRGNLIFRDESAAHLNQLNFSFGLIKDGKASGDHWGNIERYKEFIRKNPHIRPVLSVGGWGADGFSQACSNAEDRKMLVDSTLELLEQHGFLGVDIDWEYPGSDEAGIAACPEDRENFTALLKELRAGLDALTAQDGKNRLLACALGASPKLIQNMDCPAIGQIVDQVNLMTYDIQTPFVVSHHTALYGTESHPNSADFAVKTFVAAGIPAEKIMIGAAYYGRKFTLGDQKEQFLFSKAASSGYDPISYDKLQKILPEMTLAFDEHAKAPYAVDGTTFITYDNPVSIRNKGAYAKENHLMGMMCWEYGEDSSGELLRAMFESMN